MTKLNVVIPAVNVMVEIGGSNVEFRKVDRKAQAGDIVKALSDGADIDAGAFYRVAFESHFADNNGDDRPRSVWKHEVYEKVSARYHEVKRKAAVGERIKIVNAEFACGHYGNGTELKVTAVARDVSGSIDHVKTAEVSIAILDTEYVVLEPVNAQAKAEPERLTVGDYVQISCARYTGDYLKIGEVRKIAKVDGSDIPYKADKLDGSDHDWFRAGDLEKLTEEEAFAIEKEAQETEEKRREELKWNAIGRKVGEFKRGDIVEAKRLLGDKNRVMGEVLDVPQPEDGGMAAGLHVPGGTYYAVDADGMTLITPVEQRFDTLSAAKSAA